MKPRRSAPLLEIGIALLLTLLVIGVVLQQSLNVSHGASTTRLSKTDQTSRDDALPLSELEPIVIMGVGIDHRPNHGVDFKELRVEEVRTRSDTVILGVLKPASGTVTLISIPRDTLVDVPGRGRTRINEAFATGGIKRLETTVEKLLAINVHRFVLVDFEGFESFVDNIGGVDIEIETPLRDPSGRVWLDSGTHHLQGEEALRFVRHRNSYLRQDLDRVEQQRKFLLALARKVQEGGWIRTLNFVLSSPELYKSDIGSQEMIWLYTRFRQLNLDQIEHFTLPGNLVDREYWRFDASAWETKKKQLGLTTQTPAAE